MMLFQYCSVILLLCIASTFAGYCGRRQPNCCLEKGIDQRSCNGSGTSDVTDLFGEIYQGLLTYCVAGRRGDVYRVWGFDIQFQRGVQALGRFGGLYAYFFQVPRLNNASQSDFFILDTGRCPKLLQVFPNTKGNVSGTNLPYREVLRIVQYNNRPYFPCPCQVLSGSYESFDSNEDVALNTKTSLSMSGLTCLRYESRNAAYDSYAASVIAKYGLYVKPGMNGNDGMLVQDGYPNGAQYTCTDPDPASAVGYCLRRSGYNFKNRNGPGQTCLLSQLTALCFSQYPLPHDNFGILTFVTAPYKFSVIIYFLERGDLYSPTLRGLYSAAC